MLTSQEMRTNLRENGGFTSWVEDDFTPETGYVVERTDYMASLVTPSFNAAHVNINIGVASLVAMALQSASKHGEHYAVGGWTHNGETFIGVSQHIATLDEAIKLGNELGELAIWDIANNVEITL